MENTEYIKRIHDEILIVMDEVHRLCVENKLKYYLIGGTLLGAIRHGGFIPWDDDLDIAMPREDFEKFKCLTKTKTGKYKLIFGEGYKHYPQFFMKYENTETVFYEGMMWEAQKKPGIFVDIFPLDYSTDNMKALLIQKRLVCRLTDVIAKKSCLPRPPMSLFEKMTYPLFPLPLLHSIRRSIACVLNSEKSLYFANFGSQYSIQKQHFPRIVYGEGKLIKFEGRKYFAPDDSEYVVKSIFGNNYMQLPPVEKRRTHYPKLVQFSNGEIAEFDEPINRVTVNDQ